MLPRLENLQVEIEEKGTELVFKYKIKQGVALKSYGVYAAKLAGLPKPVVRRAEELLNEYEFENSKLQIPNSKSQNQNEVEKMLQDIDVEILSPVEALMKLYELKKMAGEKNVVKKMKIA